MKFEIRCEAIKEFDHQRGAYVKCHHAIAVDSSQVGTLVRCPACGNDVEVVDPRMLADTHPAPSVQKQDASGGALNTAKPPQPVGQPSQPAGRNEPPVAEVTPPAPEPVLDLMTEVGSLDPARREATARQRSVARSEKTRPPTPPSNPGGTNELRKESFSSGTPSVLRPTSFSREHICHKCGTLLEEKEPACPNCRAPRRAVYVDKRDRKPYQKKGPFGFQLWLATQVKAPAQPGLVNWFSIVFYLFSVLMMGTGISLFVFAGLAGKFVGPVVALVGYGLFMALRYWDRSRSDPRAPIPWLGKITWLMMLVAVRLLRISRLPAQRVLDRRGDRSFDDQALKSMRDLARYKAIDLEGTGITDDGLLYLYDLRGIQFLVVKDTEVTEEGVHDLQQTIPKTWIWV